MNIEETIRARRSVRSYLPEPLSKELVHTLLEDAVQAPSAMNAQPWLFAVVQDRQRLKRYSDLAKQQLLSGAQDEAELARYAALLRNDSFNVFYDASTLVVIATAAHTRFSEADCWLAAGNLMLAARARGLGSCCIGFALDLLNTGELKRELAIPDGGEVVAAIVLGYPTEFPAPVERARPNLTAWLSGPEAAPQKAPSNRATDQYAREHPAGYLASRPPPPATERIGHPAVHDDPGFGAVGQRQLNRGEREFSLGALLPESLLRRARKIQAWPRNDPEGEP